MYSNEKSDETEFFHCMCSSLEHEVRFSYLIPVELGEYDEMYVDVPLFNSPKFFKRVLLGIKYIFGYKSKYGQFDEVVMDVLEVTRLRDFLNKFLDEFSSEAYG